MEFGSNVVDLLAQQFTPIRRLGSDESAVLFRPDLLAGFG
jgi:hypothetical protein